MRKPNIPKELQPRGARDKICWEETLATLQINENVKKEFQSFFLKQMGIISKNRPNIILFLFKALLWVLVLVTWNGIRYLIIGYLENFDYCSLFLIDKPHRFKQWVLQPDRNKCFQGSYLRFPHQNLLSKVMEICRDITPFAAARNQCLPVFLI